MPPVIRARLASAANDAVGPRPGSLTNGSFRFHVYEEGGATTVFWQEGPIVCALASRMPPDQVAALAFAKAMLPG